MPGPGAPTGRVIVSPVLVLVRVPVAGVMRHAGRE